MCLDSIIMFVKTALKLQSASADQEKNNGQAKKGTLVFKNKNVQAGKCLKRESSEIPL